MSEKDITIRQEDPDQPDVAALLAKSAAHATSLYPIEVSHQLTGEGLKADNVRFLVARNAEGKAMATGAVALNGDWAELKRMWVDGLARGRGVGHKLLDELVVIAKAAGATTLRLEAGASSYMALTLYEHSGFERCQPFAGRKALKFIVFMEKRL